MKIRLDELRQLIREEVLRLYHRTSPEAADEIRRSGSFKTRISTGMGDEVYFSDREEGAATGYGASQVAVDIPEEYANLDDEFEDGEKHYWVDASDLRHHGSVVSEAAEPVMNEEVSVEYGDSPLKYDRAPNVMRISLVDMSSPEYRKWDTYFAPSKKSVFYGPSGRKLKKPQQEVVPGAAPGTVAFLDYHMLPGKLGVYIDYVKTRSDMRGQGHAAQLIDELVKKFGEDVRYDFGKIMSPSMGKLQKKLEDRGVEVGGWHDY